MSLDLDKFSRQAHARPVRRLIRVQREFLCEVKADGLAIEGKTVDLNEQGVAVVLPEPLFARLDSATIVLTKPDGSLCKMTGRVIRQQHILWGAVLQVKFVTVKALPIGIEHRGADTLVRFRVDQIQEGEERWRDLHYSYWRHLS